MVLGHSECGDLDMRCVERLDAATVGSSILFERVPVIQVLGLICVREKISLSMSWLRLFLTMDCVCKRVCFVAAVLSLFVWSNVCISIGQ